LFWSFHDKQQGICMEINRTQYFFGSFGQKKKTHYPKTQFAPSKDTVSFSAKEFSLEMYEQMGERFVGCIGRCGSTENAWELYKKYEKPFYDYLHPDDKETSRERSSLRHEWGNTSAMWAQKELYLPLMRKQNLEPEQMVKTARDIVDFNNELLRTYEHLRNFSDLSMKEAFEEAFNVIGKFADKKNITLNIDKESLKLLDEIKKDTDKFDDYTIFDNLLGNAVKYSPEGSVIDVEFSKDADKYSIAVSDHGIGILPEDQEKVLMRGGRGSNTGDIKGTGKGMADVVEAAGGKHNVKITSPLYPNEEKYKGTKFEVVIHTI
jgi:hypothetical protein